MMTEVSATWSPTGTAQHGDHENQSGAPFVHPGLGLRYQTCLLPTLQSWRMIIHNFSEHCSGNLHRCSTTGVKKYPPSPGVKAVTAVLLCARRLRLLP